MQFIEGQAFETPALAAREFEEIRLLARRTFGLELKSGKEELVSSRLGRLVRNGNFRSFREYYRHVIDDRTGRALAAMIDALATNHTAFLRERDHFQFLTAHVLPELDQRADVDIWSAASSTGEEVWTLACVLNDALPCAKIRIAASDISGKALKIASEGIYPADRCRDLPEAWLARYFVPEKRPAAAYRVKPEIRSQVTFRRVNLIEPISWNRCFTVIFCRNVMIYFDQQTQQQVVRKLSDLLCPGGYLFVGHSESLSRISHELEYVRPAVYRKIGKRGRNWTKSL